MSHIQLLLSQEFTFGIVKEDEVSAIMGDIAAPENGSINDGDLLCTVFHPKEGVVVESRQPAPETIEFAASSGNIDGISPPSPSAGIEPSTFSQPASLENTSASTATSDWSRTTSTEMPASASSVPSPPQTPPAPVPAASAWSSPSSAAGTPAGESSVLAGDDYLSALGGGPVKMPPKEPPKTASTGMSYLDNMSAGTSAPDWSNARGPEAPAPAASVPATTPSVPATPAWSSDSTSTGEASIPAGDDYLSALGGAPAKKMPPREPPKTASTGMSYLDNMRASNTAPDWSNARGPEAPAPAASFPATPQAPAAPVPATSSWSSDSTTTGGGASVPAGDDYLSALGGGPAKKMPPKEKPKTASMGMSYLDSMSTSSGAPDWSNSGGTPLPAPVPAASETTANGVATSVPATEAPFKPAFDVDPTKFTEPVPIRMPGIGKEKGWL